VRRLLVIHSVALWMKRGRRREHMVVTTWMATMPANPDSQTASTTVLCAVASAGPLRVKVPPENWFVPLGSNRSGGGGNKAVGASGVEGHFW
jgi:hypothetical protein